MQTLLEVLQFEVARLLQGTFRRRGLFCALKTSTVQASGLFVCIVLFRCAWRIWLVVSARRGRCSRAARTVHSGLGKIDAMESKPLLCDGICM